MAASTADIAESRGVIEARVPGCSALDQERNEVYESVIEAARRPDCDIDRKAACALLLRNLASTEKKPDRSYIM